MTDATELLAIFSLLYFLECLQLVPVGSIAVQTIVWRFRVNVAMPLGLWRGRAVQLGMALPPLGTIFLVERWPITFDEEGFVGGDGEHRSWTAAKEARADQMKVRVDKTIVAQLS